MLEEKNSYSSEQLDRLVNEIEGRLNDFETGISDKDETIKSFVDLVFKVAISSTANELDKNYKSELKSMLNDLITSNHLLGSAEYDRNPSYSSDHFHYKAEMKAINFMKKYMPEYLQEISDKLNNTLEP